MKILRKVFYFFSPRARFWLRRLYYLPNSIFEKKSDNIPPKSLIYTGRGDFLKQGLDWKSFFIENGLQPDHKFLDIGSGIGRIALGLKEYLIGEYQGFEAIEVGVKWCQENISNKYSNFHFRFINLYNDLYNSGGMDASEYKFDYPSHTFDFVCAISVFTHMIDIEVENYLMQSALVMKDSGRFVATFFIVEGNSQDLSQSGFRFDYEYDNYYLMDKKVKGANVCFKREYLLKTIDKAGFDIINEIKGSWRGTPLLSPVAFQDVLVLEKRNSTEIQ